MLALLACVLFVIAAFRPVVGDVQLAYIAAAVLSAHFVVPVVLERVRQ